MQRQFETDLENIKQQVLTMAGLVEKSLDTIARALADGDDELAREVIEADDRIDQCEVEIDRMATEFIVRQQPLATDLRFVIVAIKLGPELERIADHAVNIARYVLDMEGDEKFGATTELGRMLALSRAMVSDAIAAYVARDAVAAREVIDRDDEVDRLYWKTFRDLLKDIVGDPNRVAAAISQILVARFAERIADQATNISEEVVYLVEGTPIRHMAAEHQHVTPEEDTTDGS
jgi:phosphate transport system protein